MCNYWGGWPQSKLGTLFLFWISNSKTFFSTTVNIQYYFVLVSCVQRSGPTPRDRSSLISCPRTWAWTVLRLTFPLRSPSAVPPACLSLSSILAYWRVITFTLPTSDNCAPSLGHGLTRHCWRNEHSPCSCGAYGRDRNSRCWAFAMCRTLS